jgi:hypothetical protein
MTVKGFQEIAVSAAITYYGYEFIEGERKELTLALNYDDYMAFFKDMMPLLLTFPTKPSDEGILIKEINYQNIRVWVVMNENREAGYYWHKGKPKPEQKFFETPLGLLGQPIVNKESPVIQMQTLPNRA